MRSKRLYLKVNQSRSLKAYQEFKTVVRSNVVKRRDLGREEASGYSLYRVVQTSKNATKNSYGRIENTDLLATHLLVNDWIMEC